MPGGPLCAEPHHRRDARRGAERDRSAGKYVGDLAAVPGNRPKDREPRGTRSRFGSLRQLLEPVARMRMNATLCEPGASKRPVASKRNVKRLPNPTPCEFITLLTNWPHDQGMHGPVPLLCAGLLSGVLSVAFAILMGAGWAWCAVAYVIGGNCGLLGTAVLFASSRSDEILTIADD